MQKTDPNNPADPTPQGPEPHGVPTGQAMHVIYVCALAAAVMGLYFGIRYAPAPTEPTPDPAANVAGEHSTGVQPATVYADVREGSLGPNAQWRSVLPDDSTLEQLWAHVSPASEQDKHEALTAMMRRRAFHGAPPTIPHRVDPIEHISCVSCHGPGGMRLGGEVVASPMPHEHYASCTQCHVAQQPLSADETHWLENDFAGLPEPTHGQRAGVGAPPTVPHATNMRANCTSCHGPNGSSGLQSSHPWRTSCTQCHAPSATLNRQPGVDDWAQFFQSHDLPLDDE